MLSARQVVLKNARSFLLNGPRAIGTQAQILRATSTFSGQHENNQNVKKGAAIGLAALAGALAAGTATFAESDFWHPPKPVVTTQIKEKPVSNFFSITANNIPPARPDLPTIPLEQIGEHNDEGDMWFTFRGGTFLFVLRGTYLSN